VQLFFGELLRRIVVLALAQVCLGWARLMVSFFLHLYLSKVFYVPYSCLGRKVAGWVCRGQVGNGLSADLNLDQNPLR
jgi:hypothetical protein